MQCVQYQNKAFIENHKVYVLLCPLSKKIYRRGPWMAFAALKTTTKNPKICQMRCYCSLIDKAKPIKTMIEWVVKIKYKLFWILKSTQNCSRQSIKWKKSINGNWHRQRLLKIKPKVHIIKENICYRRKISHTWKKEWQ